MMWTLVSFLALWAYTGAAVGAHLVLLLSVWLSESVAEKTRKSRAESLMEKLDALPRLCAVVGFLSHHGALSLGFSSRVSHMMAYLTICVVCWPWVIGIWFEILYEHFIVGDTDSES